MRTTIKVSGLKELGQGLDQFKKSTATGVLNRVLKKAAKPVEEAARRKAPEDTGELKASIETVVVRRNAGKSAFAKAMRGGASRAEAGAAARDANRLAAGEGASATARVQATAPHAALVEFGTSKMAAHPFIGPALRTNESDVVRRIADDLKSEIEKTAARIARRTAKREK